MVCLSGFNSFTGAYSLRVNRLGTHFWPVLIVTRIVRDTLTVKVIMDFGASYIL